MTCKNCPSTADVDVYDSGIHMCLRCGKPFTGIQIFSVNQDIYYRRISHLVQYDIYDWFIVVFFKNGFFHKRFFHNVKMGYSEWRWNFITIECSLKLELSTRLAVRKLQNQWRKKKRRLLSILLMYITPFKDFSFVFNHFSTFLLR